MFALTCAVLLALPAVCSSEEPVKVVVDASRHGAKVSPFIYGQFIEHLGRCVYGGIWAEMLEDRKFYFPVTAEYDPYKSLEDTDFPVVGASPWQITGAPDSVTMTTDEPFVGQHTPRIAAGSGIRQRDLGVVQGRKYIGYIWLKSASGEQGSVEAVLRCGEEDSSPEERRISGAGADYTKHAFEFTADATSDHATLEIKVVGGADVLIGTLSLMPADNVGGMRADTLALLKQLDAPMYRWPGGNFVSGYDWRDGIGERDRRPPRKNPAWTGVEHNDVGVDEFIAFCREVNAEPLIAVNTGFGDDYSAAQEVEYCNGSADTIGGGWRAKNGNQQPYNVKYWCVGNEMFGDWQLDMKLEHYTQKHNRVASAMLKADPSLKLIGVGDLGRGKDGWSDGMLRACHDHMHYLSEHFYRGRTPWGEQTPTDVTQHVAMLKTKSRKRPTAIASCKPSCSCCRTTWFLSPWTSGITGTANTFTASWVARTTWLTPWASPPACMSISAIATSSRWPTMRKPLTLLAVSRRPRPGPFLIVPHYRCCYTASISA
jgi:alpha-N-arabinofuranosidase